MLLEARVRLFLLFGGGGRPAFDLSARLEPRRAGVDRSAPVARHSADVLHYDNSRLEELRRASDLDVEVVARVVVPGVVVQGRVALAWGSGQE